MQYSQAVPNSFFFIFISSSLHFQLARPNVFHLFIFASLRNPFCFFHSFYSCWNRLVHALGIVFHRERYNPLARKQLQNDRCNAQKNYLIAAKRSVFHRSGLVSRLWNDKWVKLNWYLSLDILVSLWCQRMEDEYHDYLNGISHRNKVDQTMHVSR